MNLRTGLNNTPYIEQPRASAPLGADWNVEINADYQKRGRKSKKKIRDKKHNIAAIKA